jgi:hypothetical protein
MNKNAKETIKTIRMMIDGTPLTLSVTENKHLKVRVFNPHTNKSSLIVMGSSPSDKRAHLNAVKTFQRVLQEVL